MARRLSVAAATIALACAACGTNNTPRAGAAQTTVPTTSAGTASEPTRTAPSTRAPTTGRDHSATTVGGRGATATPDAIAVASRDVPGRFAGVLLAPSAARAVVIDVRVEPGAAANAVTVNAVAGLLRDQSRKTIVVHGPTALVDTATTHDADAIRRIADEQGEPNGADTAVVHLLYFRGAYAQHGVLGVAVRADTIAVFPDQIGTATSPLVSEARIERAVVTHEFGHVLGLVDLFLDDNRDDPAHPGHSTNRASVMFWAVESDVVAQLFDGPPPVDFDNDDLADLARIHAGAAAQVA